MGSPVPCSNVLVPAAGPTKAVFCRIFCRVMAGVSCQSLFVFGDNNYMGDWQFVVGAYKWMDATCDLSTDKGDPLNERGRHYTQFIHAPKPNPTSRWKHGYHIIYKRCLGNKITITTCSS